MDARRSLNFKEDAEFVKLFSKRPDGIKPGLERIKPAWQKLGMNHYPQHNILIAGTNGKGTTAGFLWQLFASHGVNTGLFTSPHLCLFRERFQCSHEPISQFALKRCLCELKEALGSSLYEELSFFELTTLIALKIFYEHNCSFNILEVGLGGRLDSTNVVDPILSAICSIDLDHTEWLGPELTDIAKEKLGICRPNIPLFWGEQYTKEKKLMPTLLASKNDIGMPVFLRGQDFGLNEGNKNVWVSIGEVFREAKLPTWVANASTVVKQNFALAFAVFTYLSCQDSFSVLDAKEPIADLNASKLPWPPSLVGRFQNLSINQGSSNHSNVILDVCHNPASAKEFVSAYKKKYKTVKIPGLVSILGDKDIIQITETLREVLEPIYFFKVNSQRSKFDQSTLEYLEKSFLIFDNFISAWKYAQSNTDQQFAVCGSFLAVGEALKTFSAYPEDGHFSPKLKGTWHV